MTRSKRASGKSLQLRESKEKRKNKADGLIVTERNGDLDMETEEGDRYEENEEADCTEDLDETERGENEESDDIGYLDDTGGDRVYLDEGENEESDDIGYLDDTGGDRVYLDEGENEESDDIGDTGGDRVYLDEGENEEADCTVDLDETERGENEESDDIERDGELEETERENEADDSIVGELMDQLQMKEIEIGEIQMENEELLQVNMKLSEENLQLKSQILRFDVCCTNYMYLNKHMQMEKAKNRFGAHSLKNDDRKTCFYTGLPSYKLFEGLFQLLQPLLSKDLSRSRCTLFDELLLVLMKLRLGVPNDDLGYRFNITATAVSSIFHKWINVMSIELKCLTCWPDSVTLHENLPECFRKHYSNVICVIDCFEIFIERPVSFEARAITYSNYKRHNTLKVLIAVTPTGCISFISQAWGGRVSDKEITKKCGFLDYIQSGDIVMADRGFNVAEDLALCGAQLLIPAFTRGKKQLLKQEVEKTRQLARVRIHVERIIGQMRKKYKILQNTLPINLIKCPSDNDKIDCTIDRILTVTAALTNLSPSVIPQ